MPRYKTIYVMAIDPSMASTGYAVIKAQAVKGAVKKLSVEDYGTIKTNAKNTPRDRAHNILIEFIMLVTKYNPTYILIEDFNIGFDRKIRGHVVNRKALQLYSYAVGAITQFFTFWKKKQRQEWHIHIVPLTAPKKAFAQMLCKQFGVQQNVTTHEAECIVWAINFCKTTKMD